MLKMANHHEKSEFIFDLIWFYLNENSKTVLINLYCTYLILYMLIDSTLVSIWSRVDGRNGILGDGNGDPTQRQRLWSTDLNICPWWVTTPATPSDARDVDGSRLTIGECQLIGCTSSSFLNELSALWSGWFSDCITFEWIMDNDVGSFAYWQLVPAKDDRQENGHGGNKHSLLLTNS